jgi:uncharacterized protein (DUF433 family)
MAGKPCIRGTRIPVDQILFELGDRVSAQEVLDAHPDLTNQDIEAAVNYAAAILRQNWLQTKTILLSDPDDLIPR